ncbi:MAG TPA: zincin-like metallopeptidase domain-containing protein [Fimbriimonadaceae bacterium]|nr:zincin-like metallopeptidase domain-containing protein [Fimbriimonadaceae bacterium]
MSQHLSYARERRPKTRNVPPRSVCSPYQIVTDKIIQALERGVVPWRKPWHTQEGPPCNAVSRRPYHGVNLLLLSLAHYQDHRWLTYKQAKELGGFVRPGESSSIAVFWKAWKIEDEEQKDGEVKRRQVSVLRFYNLFNVVQCEGLGLPELEGDGRQEHERIAAAEALVRNVPDSPRLHEGDKQACYYPLADVVSIPALSSFVSADSYYNTLFHELAHATGHESRLNRPGMRSIFGSRDYAREELVAELTSAFCCAMLGLDNSLLEDSASYIGGWLKTLHDDPRAIVVAASQAQRATDYLRGNQVEPYTEPAESSEAKESAA